MVGGHVTVRTFSFTNLQTLGPGGGRAGAAVLGSKFAVSQHD